MSDNLNNESDVIQKLEARIADLENDLRDYKRVHGEWLNKNSAKQDRLESYKKVGEFLNNKGASSDIWSELERLLEPNGIFLKQRETIAKLRKALEFYANRDSWSIEMARPINSEAEVIHPNDVDHESGGEVARTALRECFGDDSKSAIKDD